MSVFTLHTAESAPKASAELLRETERQVGFVPNLYRVLAESPEALHAYKDLQAYAFASSFSPIERNVAWLAAIYEEECRYCMAGHSAMAPREKVSAEDISDLRAGRPLVDPRLEVLRGYAAHIATDQRAPLPAETKLFLAAGYSHQNALEVVEAVTQKTFSGRVNRLAETPVDQTFSDTAWDPKVREAAHPTEPAPEAMPYEPRFAEVAGSRMRYFEAGEGRPIVLLHGNPTSAYLWRNVMPLLERQGRLIAPDLIGMGGSDKPDIEYHFADHAAYFEGFLEALGIDRDLTLIVHDWGSGIGFDYAARYPDRIRAIALMEAQAAPIMPTSFAAIPPEQADIFRSLRTEGPGEEMVLDQNIFLEKFLRDMTHRPLSQAAMEEYRKPFIEREARRPLLAFPRALPIDGEPSSVVAANKRWNDWLKTSDVPKLILYADPGAFLGREVAFAMRDLFPNSIVRCIGPGLHFVQEDQPEAVGRAIAAWLTGVPGS